MRVPHRRELRTTSHKTAERAALLHRRTCPSVGYSLRRPPLNSGPVPARCWPVPIYRQCSPSSALSELLSPSALMGTLKSGEQIRAKEFVFPTPEISSLWATFPSASESGNAASGRDGQTGSGSSFQLDLARPLTLLICLEGWVQLSDLLANWLKGAH